MTKADVVFRLRGLVPDIDKLEINPDVATLAQQKVLEAVDLLNRDESAL